jgi:Flp pilus assembly protein TadD
MKALVIFLTVSVGAALLQTGARAMDTRDPKTPEESADIVAGRKALEANDYSAAIGHFTKAVQAEPKNADAHNLLGYSYRKQRVFDKSLEFYQQALKLDPKHRAAHEYLGELYLEMNQLENAEKQLVALKRACPWLGRCEEYEELKKAVDHHKAKK